MTALADKDRSFISENLHIVDVVIRECIFYNEGIVGLARDDLLQEGALLLCKAAVTYDKDKPFEPYARKVIKNGLISHCRKIINRMKLVTIMYINDYLLNENAFSSDENNGSNFELELNASHGINNADTENTLIVQIENRELLNNLKNEYCDNTTRLGIEAICLKIQGYTCKEIALMYDVKPNLVEACISRAKQKLRVNDRLLDRIA